MMDPKDEQLLDDLQKVFEQEEEISPIVKDAKKKQEEIKQGEKETK